MTKPGRESSARVLSAGRQTVYRLVLLVSVLSLPLCALSCGTAPQKLREYSFPPAIFSARPVGKDKVAVLSYEVMDTQDVYFYLQDLKKSKQSRRRMRLTDKAEGDNFNAVPLGDRAVVWSNQPHQSDREILHVVEWGTGEELFTYTVTPGDVGLAIAVIQASPSGELLAWLEVPRGYKNLSKPARLKIVDTDTWEIMTDQRIERAVRGERFNALAFGPDERYLAFSSWAGGNAVGMYDIEKQEVLWHKEAGGTTIAFHPDGESIYATSARLTRYDTKTGRELWEQEVTYLLRDYRWIRLLEVFVSPDGSIVGAYAVESREMVFWDADTGEQLASYSISEHNVADAFFGQEGRTFWFAPTSTAAKLIQYRLPESVRNAAKD